MNWGLFLFRRADHAKPEKHLSQAGEGFRACISGGWHINRHEGLETSCLARPAYPLYLSGFSDSNSTKLSAR